MAYSVSLLFISLLCLSSSLSSCLASRRREVITVTNGVVATDHGQCSTIGRNVLLEGGHAVDAAVAAALCLGVVSPASSGIGGGAFMLVRSADGVAKAFDMRESAPQKAFEDMYSGNVALKEGGALSVAVPGELAGLHEAWEQYGKISWERLVKPAAQLAHNGFKISPYLHMQMVKTESGIMAVKGLRDIFSSNGSLLQPGDKIYNKKLSKTLKAISKYGVKALYNGTIGFNLVNDVRKARGILTMRDLQHYQVKQRNPISVDFMGVRVLGMSPPSSGGAAMSLVSTKLKFHFSLLYFSLNSVTFCLLGLPQILNILAQYEGLLNLSDSLMIHREIEALKHAFAMRMNLGDPDFVNTTDVLKDMLSTKFAAKLKKTIFDNMTFNASHYGGKWNQIHDHGTSHISIVDGKRNAVSMTTTVNSYFGSKFLSPTTGILLNNEMDDFSMPAKNLKNVPPPAPANFIYPGKRPLSSMNPIIVLKGKKLKAVIGASGGSFIIAGTTEVFLNYFAREMDPFSSVMAPRSYDQLIPNVLQYENWTAVTGDHFEVSETTREALKRKGHVLQSLAGGTICQFIVLEELDSSTSGKLVAVSDPRKGGFPAGY
ncbi:glutathione hydrolase 1-like isoform X1 [Olea europaea var. sylvestris]|uniref:glutathione hydrolase 1-like isoform X1 n=1 Tax=Olea europaea var. sylvestris TaxID=158386 RepID=UPI000C1CFA3A|nr:glutathione hydrolase 1-like isoform X1 [Olea europaea var. sylvestris]